MSSVDTRERLLDAAQRLFADRGFEGTSLREITRRAGANIAAVSYHFGGKEALVEEVFARLFRPLNEERVRRLEAAGDGATVEEVLRCFVDPALRRHELRVEVCRLLPRLHAEPEVYPRERWLALFHDVSQRFLAALARPLPHLSRGELETRFCFIVGALIHTMAELPPPAASASERDETIAPLVDRLVAFAAAGLRAPAVSTGG